MMNKQQLIKFLERKENQMKTTPEYGQTFLSQAFGAVDFYLATLDNWDKEDEIINLWNLEWRPRLEAIVYG